MQFTRTCTHTQTVAHIHSQARAHILLHTPSHTLTRIPYMLMHTCPYAHTSLVHMHAHTLTHSHSCTHHVTHTLIRTHVHSHTLTHTPYMLIHTHSPTYSHTRIDTNPHTHTLISAWTLFSNAQEIMGGCHQCFVPQRNCAHLSHLFCSYLTGHKDMAMESIPVPTKCHLPCSPLNHRPHLVPSMLLETHHRAEITQYTVVFLQALALPWTHPLPLVGPSPRSPGGWHCQAANKEPISHYPLWSQRNAGNGE